MLRGPEISVNFFGIFTFTFLLFVIYISLVLAGIEHIQETEYRSASLIIITVVLSSMALGLLEFAFTPGIEEILEDVLDKFVGKSPNWPLTAANITSLIIMLGILVTTMHFSPLFEGVGKTQFIASFMAATIINDLLNLNSAK